MGSSQEGMTLLIRGDVSYDKIAYTIYNVQVFLPFVAITRSEYDGWQEGTPIPDNLQGISWKDGDYTQYTQITIDSTEEYLQLYSENLMCVNTQNAARSGTEQAADLTKTFKIMPLLRKSMSLTNIPVDNHSMKRLVTGAFKDLQSK